MASKPYCGVRKVPKGRKAGTPSECVKLKRISKYGLQKLPLKLIKIVNAIDENMKSRQKLLRELKKKIKRFEKELKDLQDPKRPYKEDTHDNILATKAHITMFKNQIKDLKTSDWKGFDTKF